MHSDRKAAGHIAKAAGIRALVLDFRRSPEHRFPAQTDDVDAAYGWLLAQGYRPGHIVSSGHSIDGNFAVSLALRLRDQRAALHSFIMGADRVPEVDEAIEQMGRWLRSTLGLAPPAAAHAGSQ